jgi:GrpB-like predicted nucleotidyltransferase (UPF0157 family)
MVGFQERLARVLQERVEVVEYDPDWPRLFAEEKAHLRACLPASLIRRIEHFGSTAVPGLAAKPIVDILVEVTDLGEARRTVVPILEGQGYEYFWRPSFGDDIPPYYAWFIKRDQAGNRTHHIHLIESHFGQWDALLFRDYLVEHPAVAAEYNRLKKELSAKHASDRVAYTDAKATFIQNVTETARKFYGGQVPLTAPHQEKSGS